VATGHATVISTERRCFPLMLVQMLLSRLFDREEGQGLAEYALILALIAIIAIVALIFLGGAISGILHNVGQSV
jgi:pilus assembly protein Flp/PilA